jgi:hypothetical protein
MKRKTEDKNGDRSVEFMKKKLADILKLLSSKKKTKMSRINKKKMFTYSVLGIFISVFAVFSYLRNVFLKIL